MNGFAALDRLRAAEKPGHVAEQRERKTKNEGERQCRKKSRTFTPASPNKIIAALEQGVRPWIQPWNAEHAAGKITRPLRHNGQPYSGINILMLWASAMEQGYAAPIWMTFKQALELDAHVRKGEKGSLVVYANAITRTEHDDATGEDVEREIPFLKGYTVFNVEQIDGLPDIYYAKAESKLTPVERIARAEAFFAHMTVTLRHGGNRAYYAQELDYVQMPPFEAFRDAESYYATLAHEFAHWTKHPSRLQRDFGRKSWGDEGYAREELVAELGSAFLCADLELHAGGARRSRRLYRPLARSAEERQALRRASRVIRTESR